MCIDYYIIGISAGAICALMGMYSAYFLMRKLFKMSMDEILIMKQIINLIITNKKD